VSLNTKRIMAFAAPVIGVALAALILMPLLDRKISPVTSGVMIGAAGAICLLGVGLGIWNVRRSEARRKAKENIWLKH
jgi:predicted lysophospholipase L1 biosynthesis ABC-type transport system permease subunit